MSDSEVSLELARLRPEMLRWLVSQQVSPELAEEVVQQALVKALSQLQHLRSPQSLKPWFRVIVRRGLLDERKRQARQLSLDPELPPASSDNPENGCKCVLRLLAELKPEYAALLKWVDLQDHSLKQVAASLGISPNLASVRLYRARKALRNSLHNTCGTDSLAACQECSCGSTKDAC